MMAVSCGVEMNYERLNLYVMAERSIVVHNITPISKAQVTVNFGSSTSE